MAILSKSQLKSYFENGDNPVETDFVNLIDSLMHVEEGAQIISSSAQNIRNLISSSGLIPGMIYKIPFQTKHQIPNTTVINTGIAEDLYLLAVSDSTISGSVYSSTYPQDNIYFDIQDTVCEDGSTPREGKITYRKDMEKNLETWYDFRNVKFRRWLVDTDSNPALEWQPSTSYSEGDLVYYGSTFYRAVKDNTSQYFDITVWQIAFYEDNYARLAYNTSITVMGKTLYANTFVTQDVLTFENSSCRDIQIGRMEDGSYNNAVIIGGGDVYAIKIGDNSGNITLGNTAFGNIIANNCSGIILYNDANNNTIANNCKDLFIYNEASGNYFFNDVAGMAVTNDSNYHIIENNVYNSSLRYVTNCKLMQGSYGNKIEDNSNFCEIGQGSYANIIASSCFSVKIGNNSYSNLITNGSHTSIIGNNCYSNIFTNGSYSNTLGDDSFYVSFTEGSLYNTIGKNGSNTSLTACSYNTVGNYSNSNTLENSSSNSIGHYAQQNNLKGFNRNSAGIYFYRTIANGLNNAIVNNSFGNAFSQNTLNGGNQNNIFGNGCSDNTLQEDSSNNVFSNYCRYNTLSEDSSSNHLGLNCISNQIAGSNIFLENNCSQNNFPTGTENLYFGSGVGFINFANAPTNLRIEISIPSPPNQYTGTYNGIVVDMISPDGEAWYRQIDNSGNVTYQKLV